MLTTFFIHCLKALAGLLVLVGGWLLVEAARRRVFGEPAPDDGIPSCHGCSHHCSESSDDCVEKHSHQNEFETTPPGVQPTVTPSSKRGE